MPTVLSIFDYSGNWAKPYEDNGWNVIRWDKKLECDHYSTFSDIMDACAQYIHEHIFENYGSVEVVLGAPLCTHFTNSGAQFWKAKDKDGRTAIALEYVYKFLAIVELCKPYFWSLENPVGRLQKLVPELGKPFYFNPCDFAGYVSSDKDILKLNRLRKKPLDKITAKDVDLVKRTGAYTKKTGLWGNFKIPVLNRIEPIKTTKQGSWLQQLGGKSEKTKEARSMTPEGFAYAFFEANNNFDHIIDHEEFFDFYELFPDANSEQQLSIF